MKVLNFFNATRNFSILTFIIFIKWLNLFGVSTYQYIVRFFKSKVWSIFNLLMSFSSCFLDRPIVLVVECSLMARKTGVHSHTKDSKMVHDTSLLNSQHYKVRFKDKVEQSRQRSSTLPYTLV